MATQAPITLFPLALQTFDETIAAVRELIVARDRLMGLNIPVIKTIYVYLDAINYYIGMDEPDPIKRRIDRATFRFLDASLMRQFKDDPTDALTRDAVSLQLVMIYAALGLMNDVEPYTTEEVQILLRDKTDFFGEEIFAQTLRAAVSGQNAEGIVPELMILLTAHAKGNGGEVYDWYGAVIYTLMLSVVWYNFKYLQPTDQALLLHEYLYIAIVLGVPVRECITEVYSHDVVQDISEIDSIVRAGADNNTEMVPTRFPDEAMPLRDLFNKYRGEFGESPTNPLGQQQYVDRLYSGQANRDRFIVWLRETINILLHMRAQDFKYNATTTTA